jgi:hypothetical protein
VLRDMLARYRRRNAEALGGTRKAAGFDDLAKDPEAGQAVHYAFSLGKSALHL